MYVEHASLWHVACVCHVCFLRACQVQHAFTKRAGHAAIANSERRLELKYGVECLTCKRSQLAEQDPDWKERMRQEYLTTSGGW